MDDKLIVMGSGDELKLRFRADALPALPAGWRRDFLLKVDGWAKDRDPNTAYSSSVEPLPFHAMSVYPYPSASIFLKMRRISGTGANTTRDLRCG